MSTDSLDTTINPSSAFASPAIAARDETDSDARPAIAAPKHNDVAERLVSLFSPILLLLLWELMVRVHLLDARFFPAPSSIVGTFVSLIKSHELLIDIKDTLGRIAVGLFMGCIPGLILGACMGLSSPI